MFLSIFGQKISLCPLPINILLNCRMKNNLTLACLLLILAYIFPSCREPKELEFRQFKNVELERLGFAGANLKVDLIYYNPNNFGLELNRTDLDIFVDSTYLGHSSQDIQIAIPKRDIFTIPLKVELDMKNLLKNGLVTLMSKEVTVRLLGKVKVGKGGVFKNFTVDYQTVQNFSLYK